MNCINCGSEARYNRAVVDLYDSTTMGGYCSDCEAALKKEFETTEEETATCLECSRFGRFALPEHHIEITLVEGEEAVREGYDVIAETPRFCERHAPLEELSEPDVDREQQRLVDSG